MTIFVSYLKFVYEIPLAGWTKIKFLMKFFREFLLIFSILRLSVWSVTPNKLFWNAVKRRPTSWKSNWTVDPSPIRSTLPVNTSKRRSPSSKSLLKTRWSTSLVSPREKDSRVSQLNINFRAKTHTGAKIHMFKMTIFKKFIFSKSHFWLSSNLPFHFLTKIAF